MKTDLCIHPNSRDKVVITQDLPGHTFQFFLQDIYVGRLQSETGGMGVSPEECVSKILRGVERNKATIVIGWWAKILWRLQRLSPGLVYWMMRMVASQMRKSRIERG